MSRRLASLLVAFFVAVLVLLPAGSASAAAPWWQVLTGSRPTNLWKPKDPTELQQVSTELFFGLAFAAKVEVGGSVLGCLGTGTLAPFGGPSADELCEDETGFAASETAAEFEAMLEGSYGAGEVEVSGGPVGALPFEVKSPWGPPIKVSALEFELFGTVFEMGTASTTILGEASGRLFVTLTNLGDAPVDGRTVPITIEDQLPEGAVATGVQAFAGLEDQLGSNPVQPQPPAPPTPPTPVECDVKATDLVVCSFAGTLPSYESIEIEISVSLGQTPVAGEDGAVSVSGGNAPPESVDQPIRVSPDKAPFGLEYFSMEPEKEGGEPETRAGSHPFQLTTTIQLNSGALLTGKTPRETLVEQPALPRNLSFPLPIGLVGNLSKTPRCQLSRFFEPSTAENCTADAAIGVASTTIIEPKAFAINPARIAVPVFNLPPAEGEPARFGFNVKGTPVVITTAVDPDDDYRIIASVRNATQLAQFLSSTVVLWGTPGDPRHDSARGFPCTENFDRVTQPEKCVRPAGLGEEPLLRLPVSCQGPLDFGVVMEPWNVPTGAVKAEASFGAPGMQGCNKVGILNPTIAASPTSKLASNPSGLNFQLDLPNSGMSKPEEIAEAQAKKVEVTLPEGMSINPSQAEGLVACSPADYARERFDSPPGAGCPEASKIGDVQISTPLLNEEVRGSLYVAAPFDNPFNSLIALYMVAKTPERGVLVKQAGVVRPDPKTGQIVATFDDIPQIPFSSFRLHFREGGRAPLVTPPACGDYDIVARFTPWSAADPNNPTPAEIVTKTSTFTVERGVDGGACPGGGVPPFHPELSAGTISNAAGHYSPFNVRLARKDGEQEFTNFSIKLPPGVIGKLAGVGVCSAAAIAAAKARTGPNGGLEEIEHPSCPASSYVGRTLVGAGVGASLTYVPGQIYLAGPFNGAPISLVSITAARVGPFDLGTVVLRLAVRVNPETAEVFVDPTGSDPIPHIIQGVPVHARDIRAYVDRPEFILNPTSCERTSTASTVLGSGLDFGSAADDQPVTVTSPFQAADCASLGFKPQLSLQLLGGTKRGDTPRLKAVFKPRKGDANVARAQVTLPHSAFLEQAHIRTVCTRVQFKAGGGNGEKCPKGSVYGKAKAITPLLDEPAVGKVYLRSSDNELPDIVAALHTSKADVNLVGRIDSLDGRIRTTFESTPDVPVTKFTLEMQGGQKGLIVNSTNICKGEHRALVNLKGQNGRRHEFKPVVKAKCGGKKAKKGKARAR